MQLAPIEHEAEKAARDRQIADKRDLERCRRVCHKPFDRGPGRRRGTAIHVTRDVRVDHAERLSDVIDVANQASVAGVREHEHSAVMRPLPVPLRIRGA